MDDHLNAIGVPVKLNIKKELVASVHGNDAGDMQDIEVGSGVSDSACQCSCHTCSCCDLHMSDLRHMWQSGRSDTAEKCIDTSDLLTSFDMTPFDTTPSLLNGLSSLSELLSSVCPPSKKGEVESTRAPADDSFLPSMDYNSKSAISYDDSSHRSSGNQSEDQIIKTEENVKLEADDGGYDVAFRGNKLILKRNCRRSKRVEKLKNKSFQSTGSVGKSTTFRQGPVVTGGIKKNKADKKPREYPLRYPCMRFVCQMCDAELNNVTHYQAHRRQAHGNMGRDNFLYKCTVCGASFASETGFKEHYANKHTDRPPRVRKRKLKPIKEGRRYDFQCLLCDDKTPNRRYYHQHLRTIHPDVKADAFRYTCPIEGCPYTSLNQASADSHYIYHHTKQSFVCETCGATFQHKSQLLRHNRTRHEFGYCALCNVTLTITRLVRHNELEHSEAKICQYCGKHLRGKKNLDIHVRLHTGEKPVRCKHCDFRTMYYTSLVWHMMKKHPEKPRKHWLEDYLEKKKKGYNKEESAYHTAYNPPTLTTTSQSTLTTVSSAEFRTSAAQFISSPAEFAAIQFSASEDELAKSRNASSTSQTDFTTSQNQMSTSQNVFSTTPVLDARQSIAAMNLSTNSGAPE